MPRNRRQMVALKPALKWCLFSILFSAVVGVTVGLSMICYETNDDPWMLLIASGAYTGRPESDLVFIGMPMGFFISGLYRLIEGPEWYTLSFIGIQVVSFSTLATLATRNWRDRTPIRILYIALLATFQSFFLIKLQFTTTAALAATAGLSCFAYARSYRSLLTFIGFVLIFVGINLRFPAGMLALVVGAPMLFYQQAKDRPEVRRRLVSLGICLLVSVFAFQSSALFSRRGVDWQDYMRYNSIRGEIHGRHLPESFSALPETMSPSDYELLRRFFQDPRVSASDLEALNTELPRVVGSINMGITQLLPFAPVYAAWLLVLTFIGFRSGPREAIPLALTCLSFISLTVPLSFSLIFKLRVFMSAALPCLLIPLLMWLSSRKLEVSRGRALGLALVLCGILVGFFLPSVRAADHAPKNRAHFQEKFWPELNHFFLSDNRPLLSIPGAAPLEWIDPLKLSKSIPPRRLYTTGWLCRLPYNAVLGNSFEEAAKVCVFGGMENQIKDIIPLVSKVLEEQGTKVEFVQINKFSTSEFLIFEVPPLARPGR